MTFSISKKALIRTASYFCAVILVLGVYAARSTRQAATEKRALQSEYMQSINDLSGYVQSMNQSLDKVNYTKTSPMLSQLSSKVWREAGFAKNSLSSLPIDYLNLKNTNKLLSQVGDYCVSLSKEFAKGKQITKAERDKLNQLRQYCSAMLTEVTAVNDGLQNGRISLDKVENNLYHRYDTAKAVPTVAEGFNEFEEGFTSYPTLIYDGPFSDSILKKTPERTKKEKLVSRETARAKAAKSADVDEITLKNGPDIAGRMPCYGFSGDGLNVSVTKRGGMISYLLKSRIPKTRKISIKTAIAAAGDYLTRLGVKNMAITYYELKNNIIVINYACVQNGVTLYPDLMKVGVAMDNGEVLSFDAKGYLTNHKTRGALKPSLTQKAARKNVSNLLTIKSSKLCVIPSDGLSETLCWEFNCVSKEEKHVLVYINAKTGAEEQILMLLINANGQLTI